MTDSSVTLPDSWFSETEQLFLSRAEEFRSADPFPYVVIDSFLPPEVATACARAFPTPGSEKWIHYAHLNSSKWGMTDLEQMPDELRSVTVALNSPGSRQRCQLFREYLMLKLIPSCLAADCT